MNDYYLPLKVTTTTHRRLSWLVFTSKDRIPRRRYIKIPIIPNKLTFGRHSVFEKGVDCSLYIVSTTSFVP